MTLSSNDLEKISSHINYCPRCGNKLKKANLKLQKCGNCGFHLYLNPVTTTGAVLRKKNEILLVKRKYEPSKGLWDIPGGFVDLNENLEDSLRRELKEELGINVNKLRYLESKIDLYKYRGIYYQTLGTIFEGTIFTNDGLKASDDISLYRFFSVKDFPLDKLSFKSLEEFFRAYLGLGR